MDEFCKHGSLNCFGPMHHSYSRWKNTIPPPPPHTHTHTHNDEDEYLDSTSNTMLGMPSQLISLQITCPIFPFCTILRKY